MLPCHICYIYRTWKSISAGGGGGGGGGGQILILLHEGGASHKGMGPFLWGKLNPQDTM